MFQIFGYFLHIRKCANRALLHAKMHIGHHCFTSKANGWQWWHTASIWGITALCQKQMVGSDARCMHNFALTCYQVANFCLYFTALYEGNLLDDWTKEINRGSFYVILIQNLGHILEYILQKTWTFLQTSVHYLLNLLFVAIFHCIFILYSNICCIILCSGNRFYPFFFVLL